ncbi:MAG: hypothetical protein RLZZ223_291 [Candidatus Parcubacteria bacterium]|jgi:4-amino-4-deoxy-L-arabinose transferase-like glycosyltransferase
MYKRIVDLYNKLPLWVVTFLIVVILGYVAFTSSYGDSLTVDESPHIASGYSYVSKGDYRLNPEHPPLLKLLSGASIWAGSKITGFEVVFPDNISAWNEKVNAQWDIGYAFLFNAGNDANTIIWWARLPTIFILLLGAIYIAYSVNYHTKNKAIAIISLVLYAFSPNVIAHGRLVTTDLVASLSFLIVIDIWVRYLKSPNKKNILFLTLALGFAFLSKFSTILLIPVLGLTGIIYVATKYWKTEKLFINSFKLVKDYILVSLGVILIINIVYFIAMRNMSVGTQLLLVEDSFPQDNQISQITKQSLSNIIQTPGLQYIGQYLLGQAMVIQRVGGGNTTFLIGEFTNQSFIEYFPLTYLLKEHLVITLTLFVVFIAIIILGVTRIINTKSYKLDFGFVLKYPYEINLILMVLLYWVVSMRGNLNLGIRHILPAVILTYILIAIGIVRFLVPLKFSNLILSIFGIWYLGSSLIAYPNYISYLNILAGQNQGYQIFTDSNLDWGQDLKRLNNWTKQKNIDTLYIDYFGTADIQYYLPDVNLIPIKSNDGPKIGYTAISATMFQDSFYKKKLDPNYQEYWWIGWQRPDYIIGNSILIYYNDKY